MRLTFSIALAISGFFATTSVFAVNDTDDYGLNKITHDHNITMYKTGIQWALNSKTTLRAGFNQKLLEITEVPAELFEKGEENAWLTYLLSLLKDPKELISQMRYLMMHPDQEGDMGDIHFKNGKIAERYSQPHRIGNEIVGRVWSFRDVTEKRKQEESLRLTKRAISASTHGIILIENNSQLTIMYLNPASAHLLNLNETKIVQHSFLTLFPELELHHDKLIDIFHEQYKGSISLQCKINDNLLWLTIDIDPLYDKDQAGISHFVCIINNITKSKELENILHYKAVHDALTGLPNKAYLEDAIRYRIKKALIHHKNFGLLFIDIDRFKNINDTLGHHIGDELLCLFGKRIQNILQKQDIISRISGDEFIILIHSVSDIKKMSGVANRILKATRKKFSYADHEFNITISIGVVHYSDCGNNPETLIRNADIAMYQAKHNGRNQLCLYTKSLNNTISRRMKIENELHNAIQHNEFELHYQPIYNIIENKFDKVEALLRWKNKELGQVSPTEFIPIIEDIGMMTSIGRWVIETAIRQVRLWRKNNIADVAVTINVSAKQLLDMHLDRKSTR